MERIKREILQAITTGVTASTGTTGNYYVIVPDTGATYNLIVGLTQDTRDIGFMDAFVETLSPSEDEEDDFSGEIGDDEEDDFSGEIDGGG